MKVNIGKYPKNPNKDRRVKIEIEDHDAWDAGHTLALIAYPLLQKLKEHKQGAPYTDDEDVPAGIGLRSTEAKPKENEWDIDDNHFKRYDWILDEIIWVMKEISEDKPIEDTFYSFDENKLERISTDEDLRVLNRVDSEGLEAYHKRVVHALYLFGKYFESFWT